MRLGYPQTIAVAATVSINGYYLGEMRLYQGLRAGSNAITKCVRSRVVSTLPGGAVGKRGCFSVLANAEGISYLSEDIRGSRER